jgi:DNA-binding XRE family transcriptional regulator
VRQLTIGKKIKELREAKGWTKTRLSYELGTHYNTIKYWETERNEPTIFYCILMADIFDVTLDELCCRGDKDVQSA